ncbi:MAG TPA: ester cyclase [Thermomicrobiales bacterium]
MTGEGNGQTRGDTFALAHRGSIDRILAPGQGRAQRLRGFDDEYTDIVDYIIRCTHRIWEERGIGLIYTHYAHNSVIHGGLEDTYGREQVVANTIQTLAAFPDRKLYGDDVIWSGDDEIGFHTSHHISSAGHNTGWTTFGPPTGRRVAYRAIANCFVRENMIIEEWLLRDELVLIRQLGLDPGAVAERQARAAIEGGAPWAARGPVERGLGQLMPDALPPRATDLDGAAGAFDPEDFVRGAYHEIWNWRFLNRIRDLYDPGFRCRTASGRRFQGREDFTAFILNLLAAFPDAKLTVDHVYWNGDDRAGYRVAARWTLVGTHEGPGEWGAPSGARVHVMGLSHHRIERGRFVEESTLFDEFGLLKQIWAARLG